ncbi:MAG: hypothetical protein GX312_00240 [Candidatus Phytoplasma sp.]|nr:hypothetical protein [Phytoplasma sp.]
MTPYTVAMSGYFILQDRKENLFKNRTKLTENQWVNLQIQIEPLISFVSDLKLTTAVTAWHGYLPRDSYTK